MKKGFSYIRCSTLGQAEEGFTLENQKRAIQEYCRSHNIQLLHTFEDGARSGRTVNRPEFQEMLKQIKEKNINCIVIYKIDRFARNITDFSRIVNELKAKQIELISLQEGNLTNGTSLVPNIFASVAQWESEVNSERTKDALMQKFRSGWQPCPPPIGYRSVGGEGERKSCEPEPYTAPIIRKLFELYSTGSYSIEKLKEWLEDKNILSKYGTIISFSRIHNILTNHFYYGLIRWHGQSKIGKHIPLISKELFDACQNILAKHRNFVIRERKYDFLLRGFVYCSCGMRLTADWHVIHSNNQKIAYYHCQRRYAPDCKQPYVQTKDLESQIEEKIKQIKFTYEFIQNLRDIADDFLASGKKNIESMKQALVNQKMSLELKRNRVEQLYIDGATDKETYDRNHADLQSRIDNLQAQITNTEQEEKIDVPLIEKTLLLTKDVYQTYKEANDTIKRHYLRFFYERFVVKNKEIVEEKPTPVFDSLQRAFSVRLRTFQLPGLDSNQKPRSYTNP